MLRGLAADRVNIALNKTQRPEQQDRDDPPSIGSAMT